MNLTSDHATNVKLRALLTGLVAPLAVFILALRSLRVLGPAAQQSFLGALPLYRSDVLLLILFALAGALVITFCGARRQSFVLGVLQFLAVIWALIEAIGHQFYVSTGSSIDFGIFLFSIQRLGDTSQVMLSELPMLLVVFLLQVILTLLFLPRFIIRNANTAEPSRKMGRRSLLAVAVAGVTCSAWSVIPVADNGNPSYARSNLVNFAFSMGRLDDGLQISAVIREPLDGLRLTVNNRAGPARNLVLVILESTRASATTLHNPNLLTTPFLNSLKDRSLFAERAYAVVPHTSKALVAIHCGIEPHLTMPITEAGPAGIPARCLPELLRDAGYRSVYFQSATRQFEARDGLVENLGFDEFFPLESLDREGMEQANYFGLEDAVMLSRSRQWLQDNGERGPFMATYLTNTPHHDYRAPGKRYGLKTFSDDDQYNRYLNSVRYVDQFSRELVEQYKEAGAYDNTVFVFVGDHGEAFDEHGRSQHDNVMWEEGLHIPLLIFDPAATTGRIVSAPVNHLDLMPTLLEMLSFGWDGAGLPGEVLWKAGRDRTLNAHCWYELGCMASIGERYKYIEFFGRRENEFYDLHNDKGESVNLHRQLTPAEVEQARAQLVIWRQSVNSLY